MNDVIVTEVNRAIEVAESIAAGVADLLEVIENKEPSSVGLPVGAEIEFEIESRYGAKRRFVARRIK